MTKYFLLGRINQEYVSGMLKDPDQDTSVVMKKMLESMDMTFHSMDFTRGIYDVVGICEAPDFETVLALKTAVMRGGAMAALDILEAFDFNAYANKAVAAVGDYTKPGE